jgi:hypothetical protein
VNCSDVDSLRGFDTVSVCEDVAELGFPNGDRLLVCSGILRVLDGLIVCEEAAEKLKGPDGDRLLSCWVIGLLDEGRLSICPNTDHGCKPRESLLGTLYLLTVTEGRRLANRKDEICWTSVDKYSFGDGETEATSEATAIGVVLEVTPTSRLPPNTTEELIEGVNEEKPYEITE